MEPFLDRLRKCDGKLTSVLEVVLGGKSPAIVKLRKQLVEVCADILARAALLVGASGVGKSTIARAVALGRYIHLLTPDKAQQTLKSVRTDGPARLTLQSLNWYNEISLPTLDEKLAVSQLFGHEKGSFTGATEQRLGIFETAARGHVDSESRTEGARATNGVVFLDEIGDLDETLQPKLLAVLSGATMYRFGGEGIETSSFSYKGLIITGTWKPLTNVRSDLVSRLSEYVIRVPGLNEREEDLEAIVQIIVAEVTGNHKERLLELDTAGVMGYDKARINSAIGTGFALSFADLQLLRSQCWAELGELRGLTQVLRRSMINGATVTESLEHQRELYRHRSTGQKGAEATIARLMRIDPKGSKFGKALGDIEREDRAALESFLKRDGTKLDALAAHFGTSSTDVKRQLYDLTRERKRPKKGT